MKYDVDYFINKFEAIPEEEWGTGTYNNLEGQKCAYGHCGAPYNTEETEALDKIRGPGNWAIATINDGKCPLYNQDTPKQRILAALNDLKK